MVVRTNDVIPTDRNGNSFGQTIYSLSIIVVALMVSKFRGEKHNMSLSPGLRTPKTLMINKAKDVFFFISSPVINCHRFVGTKGAILEYKY